MSPTRGETHVRARRLLAISLAACIGILASTSALPGTGFKIALAATRPTKPNLFDPTSQANSIKHLPPHSQVKYKMPAANTSDPSPMGCRNGPFSMQPAIVPLAATAPSNFTSNDGRLIVDVPSGAVSPAQIAADGGSTSLLVRQILSPSGGNAGGSGQFSFGTYLIQVVGATGQLASHGLLLPVTLSMHYGNGNGDTALDVAHAYSVINATVPPCVNLDPTSVVIPAPATSKGAAPTTRTSASSGPREGAASGPRLAATPSPAARTSTRDLRSSVGRPSSRPTRLNSVNGTLTTSALLSSPTSSVSWGTESAVATFGKPYTFEVGLSGASLTTGYPIDVPAGPKGFKPPITLAYNSAGVSDQHNPQGAAGWVGEGWNLTMGAISWGEHYVNESGGTAHWQNSWELNDAYGTSATLVPPKTSETIYYDDSGNAPDYGPTQWQTVPETFVKIYDYQGTFKPNGSQVAPCWRVFLRNGVMEEFGCTPDSVQWYPGTNSHPYISSWLLDLIIEPDGNQIHVTYQQEMTNTKGITYPRDAVLNTVEWDSPTCLNPTTACTAPQWTPLMRVSFSAQHNVLAPGGPVCTYTGGSIRCDDPLDLSGSGGMASPLVQSDFVLNKVQVQVFDGSPANWNTLKDYTLFYEQSAQTTITDPVSGKQESIAGYLLLDSIAESGDDFRTFLPSPTFTYTNKTEYYEDSLLAPTPATNCGPSWNKGSPGFPTCRLWSQSYAGNSYYISTADNGLGLEQSFSWVNLRNNTHGITGGGDASDPLYCTNNQNSQFPCDMPDDETWSRIGLSQQTNSLVRLTQAGQGGAQTSTPVNGTTTYAYKDVYPLSAQECPTCVAGYSWGNQDDNDYLDFYNGKFMGFAQVSVSHPDGSKEIHNFDSTEGWGVYNTAKVQITCPASPPDVCHNDPWWDQINALHGHEFELLRYAADGTTPLERVLTYLTAICTPSWVPSGSPPVTTYGDWDGNLVNTLDLANPVAPCWIATTKVEDYIKDGSTNSSAPVKTTTFTYENAARPCPTCWGRLTSETTSSNDGSTNASPTSITNTTSYVWKDTVCGGCAPVVGTYLVDIVASSDTEDTSANRYQCTFNSYDAQTYATGSSASLVHGDLTEVDRFSTTCGSTPSSSTGPINTKYGFDSFGNPLWRTDPDGHLGCLAAGSNRSSCTTFDTYFDALATQQTNALNQSSSTSYQVAGSANAASGFGLWPVSTTDINNQLTSYAYDALGRPTSVVLPGETTGLTTQGNAYTYWCNPTGPLSPCLEVDRTQRLNNSTTVTYRAFYDGKGHLVETRSPAPGSKDVVQYYYYDPSQRLVFKSIPYLVAAYTGAPGSAAYSIPDSTIAGTSYAYDGLGRTTSVTDPLSESTTSGYTVACNAAGTGDTACYEQVITVDALNHQSGVLTDAMGRINYEQRYTGNSPATYAVYATTKYTYDYLAHLTQILHPDGSTRTNFQFDMAGRQTGLTDPDRGAETYSYDQDGNLIQSIDARGSTGTAYIGYDAIDRPIWRNTTNSPTGAYDTYTYDSTASGNIGIGRLTSETFSGAPNNTLSGSYSYVYNVRGQQTSATLTVGTTSHPLSSMTYNDAGSLLSETYPDGEIVNNIYDSAAGWLSSVTSTQGSTTTTLMSNAQYTSTGGAYGQITTANLGGTTPVYAYSATFDALDRATDLKVKRSSGGATLFEQARTFDAVGNVSTANTTLATGTDSQAFCYDEQNRLTAGASNGTLPCTTLTAGSLNSAFYNQSFGYDNMGRLTSGPLGAYAYGNSAHVHGATAIGSTYTASYDASGSMSCRAPSAATTCSGTQTGAQLTYNNEGQLSNWKNQPTSPTSTAVFLYDGQGNRVAQRTTSGGITTTTVYVGNVEQNATTSGVTTKTTYYYANGARFAMAVNGVFSYLASDGLGCANVTLDASGMVTASLLYAPYGSVRYSNGTMPSDYGFTGQHSDATSGLDYYGARYYDPVGAEFGSADKILPGTGFDTWGLSRYAYVEGNPVIRTDPTGYCSEFNSQGDPNVCWHGSQANVNERAETGPLATSPPRPKRGEPLHNIRLLSNQSPCSAAVPCWTVNPSPASCQIDDGSQACMQQWMADGGAPLAAQITRGASWFHDAAPDISHWSHRVNGYATFISLTGFADEFTVPVIVITGVVVTASDLELAASGRASPTLPMADVLTMGMLPSVLETAPEIVRNVVNAWTALSDMFG